MADMPLIILTASTTGTADYVAEELGTALTAQGIVNRIVPSKRRCYRCSRSVRFSDYLGDQRYRRCSGQRPPVLPYLDRTEAESFRRALRDHRAWRHDLFRDLLRR